MAVKIYISGGAINIDDGVNDLVPINPRAFDWRIENLNYSARDKIDNTTTKLGVLADIQNEDGEGFNAAGDLTSYLNGLMKGLSDTSVQDSTEPSIIAKMNQVLASTTTVGAVAIDDYQVTLASVTSVVIGTYLVMFNPDSNRFMTATVIGISSTPTFDIDTPFDFAYPAGTFVDVTNTNMKVDGSGTPVIFGLRGTGAPPGVQLTAHITRIIISCICTSAVDLSKFANIGKLLRGIVLRKVDGTYANIFNVKSNREIAGIMYDWTPFSATNPQQGIDGFVARITFAGKSKIGVVKQLKLGEDIQMLIQDALDAAPGGESITELEAVAEGHISID